MDQHHEPILLKTAFAVLAVAATHLFFAVVLHQSPALADEANIKADDTYVAVGEESRTPYGWADLCGRQRQECQVEVLEAVDLRLDTETSAILQRINDRVNREITPVSNYDHWGTMLDHWDYPSDGKGDCKIYALWKRKLLMDIGFPRQSLLLTIVRDKQGNGHTILDVKTTRGDIILDNMTNDIVPWDATGYTYVKRQSQSDPNVWVTIGPPSGSKTQKVAGRDTAN